MTEEIHHPSQKTRKRVGIVAGTVVPAIVLALMLIYTLDKQTKYEERMKTLDSNLKAKEAQVEAAQKELNEVKANLETAITREDAVFALRTMAGHGYAILDKDGHIVEWNKTLENWTGYSRDELVGQDLRQLMSAEKMAPHEEGYAKIINDPNSVGKTFVVECQLVPRTPDKPPIDVRVNARVVRSSKGDPYALALIDRLSRVVNLVSPPELEPESAK